MTKLPGAWIYAHLGDLIQRIESGKNIKCIERPPENGERGIVKISAVTWGTFQEVESKTVSQGTAVDERARIVVGDLLISRANTLELVGAAARVHEIAKELYLSDKVLRLRADPDLLPWIHRALTTPEVRKAIGDASSGNQLSMRNISQDALRSLPVPVAPLREQMRILAKLESILRKAERCHTRLKRVPQILKRFREAVLEAAVSGRLTEEWRVEHGVDDTETRVALSEIALSISYGTSAKSQRTGAVPVLRMGNIQSGFLDWTDLVFTSDPDEIEKYKLDDGDVLFNRTNSPELVGKTGVYHGNRPAIYAGYLIRVKCRREMNPDYLGYCLNSPSGRQHSWAVKSDGVSQSNINASKLGAYRIPLRPIKEQDEAVRRTEELLGLAHRIERQFTASMVAVGNLIPSILSKAFRGELVPQDPHDEPASVLLERIRKGREETEAVAQRAKGNGTKKRASHQTAGRPKSTRTSRQGPGP